MALPAPATGETVEATDITGIKDHLEGADGATAPYYLRQSSGDFTVELSTNDGSTTLSLLDSDGIEVFSVDSNGNVSAGGSVNYSTLTFPTSATPTQTAEGEAKWDTDDDILTVGDGTSRRNFQPFNKGTNIASAASLALTNDFFYHVTGTTTITGLSTKLAGKMVVLTFDSALKITHNSTSLILRGGLDIQTAPGDVVVFVSEGSGNWREIARASTGDASVKSSAADQSVSSANTGTTFVDITGLTIPIAANGVYDFRCKLAYTAGGTEGLKIGIKGPTNCAVNAISQGREYNTGNLVLDTTNSTDISGTVLIDNFDGTGSAACVVIEGVLRNGATAGNVTMRFAQVLSGATNTTILAGAFLQLTRTK